MEHYENQSNSNLDLAQFDDAFETAEVEEREFEAVPDGKYQVNVDRVELTRAQTSGNPMLKWTLRILAPTHKGRLLWRNNVPFNSREAVSQALLWGDFSIAAFLRQVLGLVFGIEAVAALLLWLYDPVFFYPFSAVFHAISAFCNAGFDLMGAAGTPFVSLTGYAEIGRAHV